MDWEASQLGFWGSNVKWDKTSPERGSILDKLESFSGRMSQLKLIPGFWGLGVFLGVA
jgi:hypothetical protein